MEHEVVESWYAKREDENHDPTDFHAALNKGYEWGDEIPIGLFWKKDLPALHDLEPILHEGGPLAYRPLGISKSQSESLMAEMM